MLPLLSYKLHVPDPVIGTIATCSAFAAILGIALSTTGNVYIFGKSFNLKFCQSSINYFHSQLPGPDEYAGVNSDQVPVVQGGP